MGMWVSDVERGAMKILSENIHPIVLATEKAVCDLSLNLEYQGILEKQCCESNCMFLRLENIFGAAQCPDYDLYLQDAQRPEQQVHLGVLSLATTPPRSTGNFHGVAQTVKMDRNAVRLAIEALLSSGQLTLVLEGQQLPVPRSQAVIELVYLCLQPADAFHEDC